MSFDNGTADRQSHAQALRLSRIEGIEKTIETLRIQPWAGISHRNQYVSASSVGQGFILERVFLRFNGELSNFLRAYPQLSLALAHSTHGFDGVD
jgi:hypothetical protein